METIGWWNKRPAPGHAYYVIRYTSHSTTGGKSVGTVYVTSVREQIPGYPVAAYSHSKDLGAAARWTYEAGVEAIREHTWPEATLVLAGEASAQLP